MAKIEKTAMPSDLELGARSVRDDWVYLVALLVLVLFAVLGWQAQFPVMTGPELLQEQGFPEAEPLLARPATAQAITAHLAASSAEADRRLAVPQMGQGMETAGCRSNPACGQWAGSPTDR